MRRLVLVCLLALGCAPAASAAQPSWAKPQIQKVVAAGFLADSVASFRPDEPLTQQALEQVVAGLNERFAAAAAVPAPDASSWDEELVVEDAAPPEPPWPPFAYRATVPAAPVTIAELDRVLVKTLGLSRAAEQVRTALVRAGLKPPARAGTETIARLLGLRLNHPAGQDDLELTPDQPATRAEAAYTVAAALSFGVDAQAAVSEVAASLELPELTDWQRQVLRAAVRWVGYPYVWGGTTPAGFDCSGFVWQVYKLTPYAGAGSLADTLRGRTTYEMSGEVGRAERIYQTANLKPGDVLFFGKGPQSKPSEVDHAGIYVGGGWMIHSSGNGVTLIPFDGWYARSFAWARRPLREAGLDR